jgi:hypothetical protein
LSKIRRLQALVQHGLYYLTEHACDEALADGLDIFDVEYAILTGKIRRSWSREGNTRSSARRTMADALALFAGLLLDRKSGSLPFTRTGLSNEETRNHSRLLGRGALRIL